MRVLSLGLTVWWDSGRVTAIQFAADSATLFASVGDDAVWWDFGKDGIANTLGFSPVAISPDLNICMYDTGEYDEYSEYTGLELVMLRHVGGTRVVSLSPTSRDFHGCFSPSGTTLAITSTTPRGRTLIHRWDVPTLFSGVETAVKAAELDPIRPTEYLPQIAYTPDGKSIAAFGRRLWLFDNTTRKGTVLSTLFAKRVVACKIVFSADGSLLADLRMSTETVRVWDIRTGTIVGRVNTGRAAKRLTGIAFAPDGRTLAGSSIDGTVAFWDTQTFAETARFDWHLGPLHCVAFAPDGLTCAAGADGGRVVLWDVG